MTPHPSLAQTTAPRITPYINTLPPEEQPPYPGDRKIERQVKSIIRWNAMMMVARANHLHPGLGGHIASYQSAAALYEVGFNWFFRARSAAMAGDLVYFQGHAAPGIYARAFLEGRLTRGHLERFRQEVEDGRGLSSYPHPRLMPDFWETPTVSMGLAPLQAIYQARFNRYLEARGLLPRGGSRIWVFAGDGEFDEPESRGALHIAAREELDNLTFVINANLQRLDGPVWGNGKIIQELEASFHGAGWNVIKVIWGDRWDPLLANDTDDLLKNRMEEVPDGQYQTYAARDGAYTRSHFFGTHPDLLRRVEHLSDDDIRNLNRGGHDPSKIHAAFRKACEHKGQPTVIIAKTIKGFGMEKAQGRMGAHQKKKMEQDELKAFRDRFEIPVSDEQIKAHDFCMPDPSNPVIQYMLDRRHDLGGFVPARNVSVTVPLDFPDRKIFTDFFSGSSGVRTIEDYIPILLQTASGQSLPKVRPVSTTMVMLSLLSSLLRDAKFGSRIVPIVPDEGRTFGMDALFNQVGIYANRGQIYEPSDKGVVLYYREAPDGQILEEGITEAGGMSSFIAAATSYATHGVPMVPFYFFYSMFGPQRIGDLIWACGDMRGRGFLLGATSGRTTLNGEGLQHADGHSPVLASVVPSLINYHPAFAYEIALIVEDGLRRMHQDQEDIFYYITLHNENLPMPPCPDPEAIREGVLKGIYCFSRGDQDPALSSRPVVDILASDALIVEAVKAQKILAETYQVAVHLWSVTSYTELRREALETERWNREHPGETPRIPYITRQLSGDRPAIAVSDFITLLPDQVARWVPGGLSVLGTDGYGRSDTREKLRSFFGITAHDIAYAALDRLVQASRINMDLGQVRSDLF